MESSSDFNPIRNWANELHAKETSKKVRSVKKMQAERGERLGGRPPYGYRKKDAESKDIVSDEETAPIVQRIFELCASGKGPNQIARILTKENVLTPELLRLFIQRIEIGERSVKYSRSATQSIRIVYRDIGIVDSAMGPDEQQPSIAPPLSETCKELIQKLA